MIDSLKREEKRILNVVSRYGCLSREQIAGYMSQTEPERVEGMIRQLLMRQYVVEKPGGLIASDPLAEASPEMMYAFWVFLRFADKVRYNHHYQANYPGQIYFLADQKQYEIVVVRPGREHLISQISASVNTLEKMDESDSMHYIFVIFDAAQMPALRRHAKGLHFMAALLDDHGPASRPGLRFARG